METSPDSFATSRESRAIITLSLVPGIGSARCRTLIGHFGSACSVLDATESSIARVDGVGKKLARAIHSFTAEQQIQHQIECAQKTKARLVTYWSNEYPPLLRTIFDPPAFLWVRGSMNIGQERTVAIVGTRRPSSYGKRVTALFARQLVENNFIIVSGLAHGIDAAAHQSALEAGGYTIAVLGSGVDRIYPDANQKLARHIAGKGAIVSEYPMQAKPDAANFPRRNRIIAGLSKGTLVTEAFDRGGALITARLAVEQNRDVFAVPGSVFSDSSCGTHHLIQNGYGKLVNNIKDILDEFGEDQFVQLEKTPDDNEILLASLQAIERRLYELIPNQPVQINEICEKSGLDPSTVLVYLLNLEFKGLIMQMAGKQFYRV